NPKDKITNQSLRSSTVEGSELRKASGIGKSADIALVMHRKPVDPLCDEALWSADDEPAPAARLVGIEPLPVARARPAVGVEVAAIVDGIGVRPVQRLVLREQREPVVLKATVAKKVRRRVADGLRRCRCR